MSERAASVGDSGSTCVFFCVELFQICIGTIRVEAADDITETADFMEVVDVCQFSRHGRHFGLAPETPLAQKRLC